MRSLAAPVALLVLLVAAGCGERSQADQDKDGATILAALRAADRSGVQLTMSQTVVETGGDIPAGKQVSLQANATGTVRSGRAQFTYRPSTTKDSYSMVFADGQIYVKPSSSSTWNVTDGSSVTPLYSTLRITLLQEIVMLAGAITSPNVERIDPGLSRHFRLTPRSDQLEQLAGIAFSGPTEKAFLKSATGTVDFYLTAPGDHLMRVAVHTSGTDPTTSVKEKVDTAADFKTAGKVSPITLPIGAVQVPPDQILVPQ